MPGYVIIESLKLIRSPIKKTRLWAQKKVSEAIKKRREKGGKQGLSGEDAWMYFGEQVIKHDLIPIFDTNLKGYATMQDLTVPSSELAIHQRAAGYHIQAFAWDKAPNIAYVVYQPSDRAFGYISGLTHEVLPVSLTAAVERLFGKEYAMKSESMRAIHGGEWSRGVVGLGNVITSYVDVGALIMASSSDEAEWREAVDKFKAKHPDWRMERIYDEPGMLVMAFIEPTQTRQTGVALPTFAVTLPTIPIAIAGAAAGIASGVTTAVVSDAITERRKQRHGHDVGATDTIEAARDKWEAFERKVKDMLPARIRHKGLQELSDADLGPIWDHIILHINEYRSVEDVPPKLLILAKRYVRMHSELLKNMPIERVHQQYGAVMGQIIEREMKRGYAMGGRRELSPKPVLGGHEALPLGVDELVFRSRHYKDMREMPPELVTAIRNYVRSHPQDIQGMNDREMVMRFGWGFYHAAEPEIANIQGSAMARHGRVDLAGDRRSAAGDRLVERYRVALRENWSRDVSAAFTPSEVSEAVGELLYLTEGTAFAIEDLNRRELENALQGLNIQLPV